MNTDLLGIAEAMAPKLRRVQGGANAMKVIAAGEVKMALTFASEIHEPGVDVVGALPREASTPTALVGYVSTHSKVPTAAKAVLEYSSLGASLSGNFYLPTKAGAEAGVRALGYASYTIVRPSIIDVDRAESRPGETVGLAVTRLLRPLIPRRYRAVAPRHIARALLDGVSSGHPGERVIESESPHP